jgi:hypothetical protein
MKRLLFFLNIFYCISVFSMQEKTPSSVVDLLKKDNIRHQRSKCFITNIPVLSQSGSTCGFHAVKNFQAMLSLFENGLIENFAKQIFFNQNYNVKDVIYFADKVKNESIDKDFYREELKNLFNNELKLYKNEVFEIYNTISSEIKRLFYKKVIFDWYLSRKDVAIESMKTFFNEKITQKKDEENFFDKEEIQKTKRNVDFKESDFFNFIESSRDNQNFIDKVNKIILKKKICEFYTKLKETQVASAFGELDSGALRELIKLKKLGDDSQEDVKYVVFEYSSNISENHVGFKKISDILSKHFFCYVFGGNSNHWFGISILRNEGKYYLYVLDSLGSNDLKLANVIADYLNKLPGDSEKSKSLFGSIITALISRKIKLRLLYHKLLTPLKFFIKK